MNAKRTERTSKREQGQSLVEVALVLPLLLLLLIGIIEIGRFAFYGILVANAARAGAQYGAQNLATAWDNTGIQNAATNDGAVPGITMNVTKTRTCRCGNGGLGGCAGLTCNNLQVYLKVTASESVPSLFQYPGLPANMALSNSV